MRPITCPSEQELQAFQLGLLSEEALDRLAVHLESCAGCESEVQRFDDNSDPLLEAIRCASKMPGATFQTEFDAPARDSTGSQARNIEERSTPSPVTTPVRLDFLLPAQKADELGRLNSYRVLSVLGVGGMGLVLRAEDTALMRGVALKVMKPELAADHENRQRFLREAQAAAIVDHPCVIPIYQVGEFKGLPFLAMPLLKGEALDTRLERETRLPVAEAVRIAHQIAIGLAAAHEQGLVHRDIKPGNIWLDGAAVIILDFGLARVSSDDIQITKPGMIVGTPAYMSPEQASGKPFDHRCDLFSLGTLLYRMLTGEAPFSGADTMSILMALATIQPRPIREWNPGVPTALTELVMKMLAKDPAERPASALYVAKELGRFADDQTRVLDSDLAPLPPPGAPIRPRQPSRKRLALLAGAAALVMAGMLVALWPDAKVPGEKSAVADPSLPQRGEPLPQLLTNPLGMEFVHVPAGTFPMGGGDGIVGTREVVIPHDFYLGKYEVTHEQWDALMPENPSAFSRTGKESGRVENVADADLKRFPVERLTWPEAQRFIARLNERDRVAGWVYRLPTEAEWEYACRGGPLRRRADYGYHFYFADGPTNVLPPGAVNVARMNRVHRPVPVGAGTPNSLGLFNMHGNVREWCLDEHFDGNILRRAVRGGFFTGRPQAARAGMSGEVAPGIESSSIGLRVARVHIAAPAGLYTNAMGMQFAHVHAGEFFAGGGGGKVGQQQKRIRHDFYMGVTEVTQSQWQQVMGGNPSYFSSTGDGSAKLNDLTQEQRRQLPVEQVSWNDAQLFVDRLNQQPRERRWIYRLPTELEWEYACRGGATSIPQYDSFDYYFAQPTNDMRLDQANFKSAPYLRRTAAVAAHTPNRLGLFDMHGNVWEWCAADEIKAPSRMARGGGWNSGAADCRASSRSPWNADERLNNCGLRLVCVRKNQR